ncbi:MAG: phosphoribosyl-AMP cyclohydrolase [Pseudomonadota bacterium]
MKKTLATAAALGLMTTAASAMSNSAQAGVDKEDVLAAQKAWGEGIVAIGQVYQDEGDYTARATQHINELYAYEQSEVLFKPTLASEDQFRETFDEALSYFVGGSIAEDSGFAIRPWSNVRWGEQQIITDSDSAVAMGNYFFTPVGEDTEVKVEYTFGYMVDEDGKLRINVHHSSLPHSPE